MDFFPATTTIRSTSTKRIASYQRPQNATTTTELPTTYYLPALEATKPSKDTSTWKYLVYPPQVGVFPKPDSSVTESAFKGGISSNATIALGPGREFFSSQPSGFAVSSDMKNIFKLNICYGKKYLESKSLAYMGITLFSL